MNVFQYNYVVSLSISYELHESIEISNQFLSENIFYVIHG